MAINNNKISLLASSSKRTEFKNSINTIILLIHD